MAIIGSHGTGVTSSAINILSQSEDIAGERVDNGVEIINIKATEGNVLGNFTARQGIEAALESGAKVISISYNLISEHWLGNYSRLLETHDAVLVTYAGSTQTDSGDYSHDGRHFDNIIKVSRISDTSAPLTGAGVEFVEEASSHSAAIAQFAAKVSTIWSQKPEMSVGDLWDVLEQSSDQNTDLLVAHGAQNATQFGEIDVEKAISVALSGDDILNGTSEDDVIYGFDGDDILFGDDLLVGDLDGSGSVSFGDLDIFKAAFGTSDPDADFDGNGSVSFGDLDIFKAAFGTSSTPGGADTFKIASMNDGLDTIKDFSVAEGDRLDLSDVLSGYDPISDAITDFIQVTENGRHTTLSVDADGTGSGAAQDVFVINNATGIDIQQWVDGGVIITV